MVGEVKIPLLEGGGATPIKQLQRYLSFGVAWRSDIKDIKDIKTVRGQTPNSRSAQFGVCPQNSQNSRTPRTHAVWFSGG